MNRIFIAFGICLVILFSIFVFPNHLSKGGKQLKIAILTPVTHPSLIQIEKSFVELLSQEASITFKTYNAQGSKTLMHSEIEDIASKNFDLLLTIGTQASQMSKEVFEKKKISTPIVFTVVADPIKLNLIASEENSGNQLTGIIETLDFEKLLSPLKLLKPNAKKVLIVYNPANFGLKEDKEAIKKILAKSNIEVMAVEIFKTNEIMQKTSPFMDQVDAVLTLKDNTVVSGIDALVKLCNRHHVLLMASDLDSIDKGAALAFGVNESRYGIEAAKKALLILKDHTLPKNIPTTPVPIHYFGFKINSEALKAQGVDPKALSEILKEAQ